MAVAQISSVRGDLRRGMGLLSQLVLAITLCIFLSNHLVSCRDPDAVLDFCVADLNTDTQSGVWETGTEDHSWMDSSDPSKMGVAIPFNESTESNFPCKGNVQVKDFVFKGLANPQAVTAAVGSQVTPANVMTFPAVNTLGISSARIDFVGGGLNPPHVHPRATEILFVLEGCLMVGFVDTNNTLFTQTLYQGDFFVFPKGTVHFQIEVAKKPAQAFVNFDSQNPGTLRIADALLDSSPQISDDVLKATFGIDDKTLGSLLSGFD